MTLPQVDFSGPVTVWVIGLAVAYTVGRVGLPTLYQDIKHLIQGVKASVSASSTSTASK